MKNPEKPQSTTSLPRAPRDEVSARFVRYGITMGVRIACFILMVAVTPYGWYTWIFAVGAIVLPYVAVVVANVGEASHIPAPESPERALEAPVRVVADEAATEGPGVFRISESPARAQPPKDAV